MQAPRDPVETAADESYDLYDIATWEPRTALDRLSVGVHRALVRIARAIVILLAVVIMAVQFVFSGLAAIANPAIGAFILLSVVPALGITLYVWRSDVMGREPLKMLVVTFLLGILFAGFAAIVNSVTQPAFQYIPVVGMALFFYLIVAPIEETVKWLAIRLYAFRSDTFETVLDGAVYGAVAGLGFATIENSLYIGRQYMSVMQQAGDPADPGAIGAALGTAAVRSFAGPGHVIYSAFAGYYLGLAKFNRENAGPIVVKGLLVAAFIHGTYNTLVGIVPGLVRAYYPVPFAVGFIGFVIVYDGIFGYALYRKISRYRAAFVATDAAEPAGGADDAGETTPDGVDDADVEPAMDGVTDTDDWEWSADEGDQNGEREDGPDERS